MTDQQFSSLRTTITGAAFFIGGAVISLTGENFAVLIMVVGCILMGKDFVIGLLMKDEAGNQVEEKEEQTYDSY